MKNVLIRLGLVSALTASLSSATQAGPLPSDLKLLSPDALPTQGTWFSLLQWGTLPPSPVNWWVGQRDVLYYSSVSLGLNKIIVDDTLLGSLAGQSPLQAASSGPPMPGDGSGGGGGGGTPGPLSRKFGTNDLWLEIKIDTNVALKVDVILHGATNGVWQLLSTTTLAGTNIAWTVKEIQVDDGTTNDLYFGPYPDNSPPIEFYRARLATNLFVIVATNLPNPVGIGYHTTNHGFILPINYNNNDPTFGILDTNAFLTNWSGLGQVNLGYEVRFATVRTSSNDLHPGELLFGNGGPGGIGWLSADGTVSNLTWVTITNEPNLIQALYVDQTGLWSNDVLAVCGADDPLFGTNLNLWRIHSKTNSPQMVASIPALHLEGVLTLPNDASYGPWAGKLLTADEDSGTIFAVSPSGTVSNYSLGIGPDAIHLIPASNDLYCVQFRQGDSRLLKIPRGYFRSSAGDLLFEQSGEVFGQDPVLFLAHWNGNSFNIRSIKLFNYFPNDGFFEKLTFAPIELPAIQ